MTEGTEHRYIIRNPNILGGEPLIQGTRTPVRAIVELWRLGVAPEEIPVRLPHLTLAKVFAALSYYSDHQAEIHEYIQRNHIPKALIGTGLEFSSHDQTIYNRRYVTLSPLTVVEQAPADDPLAMDKINEIVHEIRQQRRSQKEERPKA
jgi:uncharacterized protein (DUF433 family)